MREITAIPTRPGHYLVSTGGGQYEVDASSGVCSCPHWQRRIQRPGALCKHGAALAEHLSCHLCHGVGVVELRERYADGEPIVCAACSGSGRRESPLALPDDATLRRLFA